MRKLGIIIMFLLLIISCNTSGEGSSVKTLMDEEVENSSNIKLENQEVLLTEK